VKRLVVIMLLHHIHSSA